MAELFTVDNLTALAILLVLEIVLGIDNIIFIAILSSKLPPAQRGRARSLGIMLAVVTRLILLFSITWIMRLTEPLFTIAGHGFSGRDLILLGGGLFLIAKSTHEIHEKLESEEHERHTVSRATMGGVIAQIVVVDMVFSLDSVITAVGLSGDLLVMVPAVIIAAIIMLTAAGPVSNFVERHPTMKILALSFLILIGSLLVIEGWNPELVHQYHLKNYAYFAMAFSFLVELVNMQLRKGSNPVHLQNEPKMPQEGLAGD
ncbi:MAG: TerC family protein [Caldilineaceae bacterium]|nr:TerC family protein [Caldilineaceae bacterium]